MADTSVCSMLHEADLNKSCRSLFENSRKNINDTILRIFHNLDNERNRAVAVNPNLSTSEQLRLDIQRELFSLLELFKGECTENIEKTLEDLPKINEARKNYLSKLATYNQTLGEFLINQTDEMGMTLSQLEREKDELKREHNTLLINYNQKVLNLQLQLDHFKQGIITLRNPIVPGQEVVFFYEIIDKFRNTCIFPNETLKQKLERNAEFNSWQEMLRLPNNWLIEVRTPQPGISENEGFDQTNVSNTMDVDPLQVPSTSSNQEVVPPSSDSDQTGSDSPIRLEELIGVPPQPNVPEFNVPSPDMSSFETPDLSRMDDNDDVQASSDQHSSPPPSSNEPFPPYSDRSPGSLSPRTDEIRSSSRITHDALRRKHDDNNDLKNRLKQHYIKARHHLKFWTTSDPFTTRYNEIQELNTTVQNLSRQWRTIQPDVQDSSRRRDEVSRNREIDEETTRRRYATMKSVDKMFHEWLSAREELKTYAIDIDNDYKKFEDLQKLLESLSIEIEKNDDNEIERLSAAEDKLKDELLELRTRILDMTRKIRGLQQDIQGKRTELNDVLDKLYKNLSKNKIKWETRIARAQIADQQ